MGLDLMTDRSRNAAPCMTVLWQTDYANKRNALSDTNDNLITWPTIKHLYGQTAPLSSQRGH